MKLNEISKKLDMKNKIKMNIKENGKFFIFYICLLLLTCGLISLIETNITDSYISLTNSEYGLLALKIVLLFSAFFYIFLRKKEKKEIKVENMFLLIVIPIGIMYCLANPLGRIPDEDRHINNVFGVAQGVFFTTMPEDIENKHISKRARQIASSAIESYEDYFKNIEDSKKLEDVMYNPMYGTTYCFINYFPQALGVIIARIFGADVLIQLYMARITNFLVSVGLMYFSIKYIPFKKYLCITIMFLPVFFNQMTSLSTDALTNSITMFLVAYTLYLKYSKDNFCKKEYIILLISSIIVAMCKIVYLPICLCVFLIPREKFNNNKDRMLKLGSIFIISCVLNLIWLGYTTKYSDALATSSSNQLKFILSNPIEYIFVFLRTLNGYGMAYLLGIIGNGIGCYNVNLSIIYEIMLFIILVLGIFVDDSNEKIDLKTRIISSIIGLIVIGLIFTSLYLQWTTIMNPKIEGIQGRYFIPVLLLLSLGMTSKNISFKKEFELRYLLAFLIFLNLHAITYIIGSYML